MREEIIVIDYGMGNLHSVAKALAQVGAEPVVTGDPALIAAAKKIILPGVGAFGDCMANLTEEGLIPILHSHFAKGTPFLGICLGMQVLFESSEEAPGVAGLGVFKGQVRLLPTKEKIPHMGWNRLEPASPSPLLPATKDSYVYFVHSFHAEPEDKSLITATCDYGCTVTAAVGRGSIQAFQFHPEKSSSTGLSLLRAFKEWQP